MKILGIDPGIERLGWGLVVADGKSVVYEGCGCITTERHLSQSERIAALAHELRELIQKAEPDRAAIERLFFAKNKKTAMGVAESRGAILLVLAELGIPIREYTPLEVKMAITGNGRAEKKQVGWMVKNMLKIKEDVTSDDALDALALCLMLVK